MDSAVGSQIPSKTFAATKIPMYKLSNFMAKRRRLTLADDSSQKPSTRCSGTTSDVDSNVYPSVYETSGGDSPGCEMLDSIGDFGDSDSEYNNASEICVGSKRVNAASSKLLNKAKKMRTGIETPHGVTLSGEPRSSGANSSQSIEEFTMYSSQSQNIVKTPFGTRRVQESSSSKGASKGKLTKAIFGGKEASSPNFLAIPLTPSIKSSALLKDSDLLDSPISIPETTPRYSFRKRTPNLSNPFENTLDISASESSNDDSGDDESLDGEWTVTDPFVQSSLKLSTNKKDIVDNDIYSTDDDGIDSDGDVRVTLPKSSCGFLKKQKGRPASIKSKKKDLADQVVEDQDCDNIVNTFGWEEDYIAEVERPPCIIPPPDENIAKPTEYFEYFFDENIIQLMTEFTNSFSTWKSQGNKCLNVTVDEMKTFLGVWIYMGVVKLPSIRDYWAAETRVPQVASLITFNRFQSIRTALHFYNKVDEDLLDQSDRYRKVSLLIQHMKQKCNDLVQESTFSIDETMILYKGIRAGNLRQYIKSKPHKFGFKVFNLAGKSGLIYDFIIYAGSKTFENIAFTEEEMNMGFGGKVVIHLARSIDSPEHATIYFDNYFSSIKLLTYLKNELNILATGTIRSNRTERCPLKSDKELKKCGRGSHDYKVKDGVQLIKWFDSKPVHIASTIAGVYPEGKAMRYDKTEGTRIELSVPRAIELYNANMGGVDLNDMLVELYRLPTRARRWYVPIVGYFIDVAIVNSWLLYKRHGDSLNEKAPLNSKQFRLSVFKSLVGSAKVYETNTPINKKKTPKIKQVIKIPRGYRPDEAIRSDGLNHKPVRTGFQGRCKFCVKGYTTIVCEKCNLLLCWNNKRDCFTAYHK